MKIFDRYILISVIGAFFFGLAMFMTLLMAMSLFSDLIKLIVRQGAPAGTAFTIFAYNIPGMLVYAFPMSVLLSILLVFNRMSSESEMVAIRASGVSFIRIVIPTLFFSLAVAGATFWISDVFAPFAGNRAAQLTREAVQQMQSNAPVNYVREEENRLAYAIVAGHLDVKHQCMQNVSLLLYQENIPAILVSAPKATWDDSQSHWHFQGASFRWVKGNDPQYAITPTGKGSQVEIEAYTALVKESPFDLDTMKKHPENYTSSEITQIIEHMSALGGMEKETGKWRMAYAQRYAVPFVCVVFALIGAPLGLRSHRASSAMGLGISLLVIFAFYSLTAYLNAFGESGALPPAVASGLPIAVGSLLGVVLLIRANR